MTKLSVNINKIATLRNARGGDFPNLLQFARDIELFGANGITVHPRPDERHIKYSDVYELSQTVKTEFNIEGNPNKKFIDLVLNVKPTQVTLVPDAEDAITSNKGWDTKNNLDFLKDIISEFKIKGIRTSVFIDPLTEMVEYAKLTGANRVELYTENYASVFLKDKTNAISSYILAAKKANELSIGVNAGHDLNLENLKFFNQNIPELLEVSIGHALITESLYHGLKETIKMYVDRLN
ncbi:MAG: pyridoxine 5'-phosphate synthase [Flavobacteriaceae bacterium]|nr:pyridoxine 5'-phosphate synthase [Flavobacteriaceae bacterium]